MGRPMFQSDVFSAGLVLYRLFAGTLPSWPYEWPPEGHRRLQKKLHPDMVALIRRAIEIRPRKRYPDGLRMYGAFQRLRRRALR
jgi:serine/threonine-protein kinase